jgi:hypothetical protein
MESVYKLSKYSQKIDEACRTNQLNKVMEYNKHELAYINKLSKYFGNQKGGATAELVVEAVKELVQTVNASKDAKMNEFLQQIDNAVEPKAFDVFVDPPQLIPDEILQKVRELKKHESSAQEHLNHVRELQGKLERIGKENMEKILLVQNESDERYRSYIKCTDELSQAQEDAKRHADKIKEVQAELAQAKAQVRAQAAELAKAKDELAKAKDKAQAELAEV